MDGNERLGLTRIRVARYEIFSANLLDQQQS